MLPSVTCRLGSHVSRPQVTSGLLLVQGASSTRINHKSTSPRFEPRQPERNSDNVVRSPHQDVHVPEMNLTQYVWKNVERFANRTALTDVMTGTSYTYTETKANTDRLSAALVDAVGLKPGETLGLLMPNSPEFTFALMAAVSLSIVVSPANPLYTPEELARQMTDAGARCIITIPLLLPKARSAVELMPGGAQLVVATDGSGTQEAAVAKEGLLSLHELMKREPRRRAPCPLPADPDCLAVLPYSSGTTGLPKGVCITHRNIVANLSQMEHPSILGEKLINCYDIQDTSLAILPFFHIYGLTGVCAINLCLGRNTVTLPRFDPALFAAAFKKYKPTVINLVPPLLMHIAATDTLDDEDLKRLRFVVSGAAAATKPVAEKFLKRVKNPECEWRQGYGMTETSCMALFTPPGMGLNKVDSAGTAVPLTEIKVVDESGEALPSNHQGELWVRGPQVMQGYHNNEEATRETLTEDGWLKTGDVAYIDEDGFVFIVDRIKELIKVKGLQVSPTELETILRKMDGIVDVAVVGVPDERAGEVPKAYVMKAPGSTITEDAVAAFLETRVAPFKRLAGGVRFVDVIPKNAGGKVLRKALKEL